MVGRYVLPGAYEPPEGRKERPTPHYSVERHLNLTLPLYGHILKWGVSVVFIANAPWRHATSPAFALTIPRAYGAGDDGKRVSQFTAMEQERERKIERLGKR